jgi:hypothetical protein
MKGAKPTCFSAKSKTLSTSLRADGARPRGRQARQINYAL